MGRRRYHAKGQKQKLRFAGALIGCTDTSFAVGVDGATLGGVIVTEQEVRRLSDETKPDPASPGLNLSQLAAVARKLNVDFANNTGGLWSQLETTLANNALVVAQLWYADIGGTPIGHAVLVEQIRPDGKRQRARIMDPMVGEWAWIDADKLQHAMQHFARMTGLTRGLRYGSFRRAPWISDDQAPQRDGDD